MVAIFLLRSHALTPRSCFISFSLATKPRNKDTNEENRSLALVQRGLQSTEACRKEATGPDEPSPREGRITETT